MTADTTAATQAWTPQDQWLYWCYRVGGYLLLNVLDEPAWLALMFC